MNQRMQNLLERLQSRFGQQCEVTVSLDHLQMQVAPDQLLAICRELHDDDTLAFRQLSDLCGVDYAAYGNDEWAVDTEGMSSYSRAVETTGGLETAGRLTFNSPLDLPPLSRPRFDAVYHLLSLDHNVRLRIHCSAADDSMPVVPSVVSIWNNANWYEREAFDLFGILFDGHPDLRRILTDYGFIGHPFRKDFPLVGTVEMRYDNLKGRVVYEPVSIEPRVLVPKVIRDDARYVPGAEPQQPPAPDEAA